MDTWRIVAFFQSYVLVFHCLIQQQLGICADPGTSSAASGRRFSEVLV